jgi:small subunit ribosomal protein S20
VANIKSAKKRIRQDRVRRLRNRVRRSIAKAAVRRFEESLRQGNHEEAQTRLRYASGRIDRAAQKGAMHANKAARMKSQIWRRFNQAQSGSAS